MGVLDLFRRKPETRAAMMPTSWAALTAAMDGQVSTVSPETASNLATYTACVSAIADTVASLQLRLYREVSNGREEVTDGPLAAVLRNPNQNQSAFDWLRTAVSGVIKWGNHLSAIERDSAGQVVGLTPIPWPSVTPVVLGSGALAFDVQPENGGLRRRYLPHEVLFLREMADGNGLIGTPRLARAPMVAQAALDAQEFAANLYRNQAAPSGAIELEHSITKEQLDRLRASFTERHTGPKRAGSVLILDNSAKWKALSVSPIDAELLSTRKFSVEEIARVMGVPPAIIGQYEHNTFASARETSLWFAQQTIGPMVRMIEAAFSRTVLPPGMHVELDMAGLLRGDFATRWAVWKDAVAAGLLTVDECREMEGFGPKSANGGSVL